MFSSTGGDWKEKTSSSLLALACSPTINFTLNGVVNPASLTVANGTTLSFNPITVALGGGANSTFDVGGCGAPFVHFPFVPATITILNTAPIYPNNTQTYCFRVSGGTCVTDFCSCVVVTESPPLPIEFTNFEVNCTSNGVRIKWTTETELNNDYFVIERSKYGKHFEELARIDGAGTSNSSKKYSFEDWNINTDFYYQVKQVDFDGNSKTFPAKYVDCTPQNTKTEFDFYINNSESDLLKLSFSESIETSIVEIYNMLGSKVLSKKINVSTSNTGILQVTNLAKGTYIIKIKGHKKSIKYLKF